MRIAIITDTMALRGYRQPPTVGHRGPTLEIIAPELPLRRSNNPPSLPRDA